MMLADITWFKCFSSIVKAWLVAFSYLALYLLAFPLITVLLFDILFLFSVFFLKIILHRLNEREWSWSFREFFK